jgi:hypothetical protein
VKLQEMGEQSGIRTDFDPDASDSVPVLSMSVLGDQEAFHEAGLRDVKDIDAGVAAAEGERPARAIARLTTLDNKVGHYRWDDGAPIEVEHRRLTPKGEEVIQPVHPVTRSEAERLKRAMYALQLGYGGMPEA